MEKQCFKCLKTLPLGDFYRHPDMLDGRLNRCKGCTRRDTRENRANRPEQYRAYERRRATAPHRVAARQAYRRANPETVRRSNIAWIHRNPEKRAAHIILRNALRTGKPKPSRCHVCQCQKRLQAHHEDYARPLWVAWVCSSCHRLIHRGVVTLGRMHHERATA